MRMSAFSSRSRSSTFGLSFGMSFCDGSARWIRYDVDPTVHRRLGNRRDGGVVDAEGHHARAPVAERGVESNGFDDLLSLLGTSGGVKELEGSLGSFTAMSSLRRLTMSASAPAGRPKNTTGSIVTQEIAQAIIQCWTNRATVDSG